MVKTKTVYAVGHSVSNSGERAHFDKTTYMYNLCSNLKLAYEVGLHSNGLQIKEPSLSYAAVNGRMRKEGKVIIFDKANYKSEDEAVEAADYYGILPAELISGANKKESGKEVKKELEKEAV